jgi:uroporphyrinogen III methyltransferase/synthase
MPRADIAPDSLPRALSAGGFRVDNVVAYRTLPERRGAVFMREMLAGGGIDAVTFTSSSTVKNFVAAVGPGVPGLFTKTAVASIGPVTSDTAREAGLRVDVQAKQYTIGGLVESLVEHFNK